MGSRLVFATTPDVVDCHGDRKRRFFTSACGRFRVMEVDGREWYPLAAIDALGARWAYLDTRGLPTADAHGVGSFVEAVRVCEAGAVFRPQPTRVAS